MNDRVAIVTGAERGLGQAAARQLAAAGFHVLPTSRDVGLSSAVVQEIQDAGGRASAYQLDVIDDASVAAFAATLEKDLGRADVLVNNAGVSIDTIDTPSEADLDIVKQCLETNLFGAWRLCKALLPLMVRANYGRIVNVSSKMGQLERMGRTSPAYRVSKTGLNALTCMLAAEVEGSDIQVNSLEPGWMRTQMGGPEAARSPEQGAEEVVWLATRPKGGPNGCFYFDRRLIPW